MRGSTLSAPIILEIEHAPLVPAEPDLWRLLESVNGAAAWELSAFGGLIAERLA